MKLIKQFDENDCGAACISMICKYYKSYTSITEIRKISGTDRNGTFLRGIITACNLLGLEAKACKGDKSILNKKFPTPFIAHVQYQAGWNHFIVVYKISQNSIYVADPIGQKVKYTINEFLKIWSGYIVLISPTQNFKIQKKKNTILKFLPLIKPHIRLILLMTFTSLLLSCLGVITGLYTQFFIDDIIGANAVNTLHTMSFALVILSIFTSILYIIRSQFLRIFTLKTDIELSLTYIKHILRLPMTFFESRQTGEILSRFEDSEKVRLALTNIAFGTILDFIIMLFVGIYLLISNSKLFLVMLFSSSLSGFIVLGCSSFFAKNYRHQLEHKGKINSYLVEMLSVIPIIKSKNADNYANHEYEKKFIDYVDLQQKAWNYGNLKEFFTKSLSLISTNLIFWVGGYFILKGHMSLGQLMSFYALSTFFITPLNKFIEFQPEIQEAIVSAERIGEILETRQEEVTSTDYFSESNTNINYPIEFQNVTFRYGTKKPVFENLSFSTLNNHKIAFVGASGCGKSTIIKLLLKFYDIEDGNILIGNKNIKQINTAFLRKKIGYVPQEVYLFSGTIFDNIVMGRNEFSINDVEKACKKAQASDFIEQLPDKYYSKINERGSSLSGGERQRIALARALLDNPQILLLDEATSALDTISERSFQKVIDELGNNEIITITIAHRLTTIINCDLIFVLNNGQIIEQGNHNELILQKGLYYKLWKM